MNIQTDISQNPHQTESESDISEEFSGDESEETWINWFLSKKENKFLLHIPLTYIMDDFNLTELPLQVAHFREARSLILDDDSDFPYDFNALLESPEIQRSAHLLYYLIHQRYVITSQGMEEMSKRYANGYFGTCPRILCNETRVVPVGLCDTPGQHAFKLFCPCCVDAYIPVDSRFHVVDGCCWGSSFAHVFFMRFPEFWKGSRSSSESDDGSNNSKMCSLQDEVDEENECSGFQKVSLGSHSVDVYEPRIFGFKVHSSSPVALNRKDLRVCSNHVTYLGQ